MATILSPADPTPTRRTLNQIRQLEAEERAIPKEILLDLARSWPEMGWKAYQDKEDAKAALRRYHLPHLTRFAHRPALNRRIEAETTKPWKHRCCRCGRTLTAVESVARGIGPVCIHKAEGEGVKAEQAKLEAEAGDRRASS